MTERPGPPRDAGKDAYEILCKMAGKDPEKATPFDIADVLVREQEFKRSELNARIRFGGWMWAALGGLAVETVKSVGSLIFKTFGAHQ